MDNISFSETGWQDYLYWQTQDRKTLKKINLPVTRYSSKW